jgi:hypothetical protein
MTTRDVHLELTDEQAQTLLSVLDEVLGELTSEIAATDNASYRASLSHRRDLIRQIRSGLGADPTGPDQS